MLEFTSLTSSMMNRANIHELGKVGPYFRYVRFPIEMCRKHGDCEPCIKCLKEELFQLVYPVNNSMTIGT